MEQYPNNVKQRWSFFHVEEERYRIANVFWEDQCLYAADRKNPGNLSLQPCSDTQDTTWEFQIVELKDRPLVTIKLAGSELYLTIDVSTRGEARDETRWRCGSGGWPADGRDGRMMYAFKLTHVFARNPHSLACASLPCRIMLTACA